ncbi:AAA family ATPase [Actinomadura barringtoniae]|uniref:AAA family ATPase n=1 Tax=Actinomadura barringtoniae TaxID=1427535 RepID=A0A939PAH9_9ACTN|nr:LuxR family transcriptional regulator [Actinomadura barringtoniae]MBO2446418.1 AAA family ATPase [Actinomadura barringtoniae]
MFVGRERELAFLTARLDEARAGDGGLVLIEGEAGAGKTALAHALTRGVRAAWGTCLDGEGGTPFRPWTQLFRSLGRPFDVTGDSRARLFDEAVEALAGAGSALLVIDDLHWADPSSLALLQTVAAELPDMPLLLVGLYRGPESPELRSLLRGRACSSLTLTGLSPGEVSKLAALTLGHDLTPKTLDGLRERSGGNPLFVLELLKLKDGHGVPNGVREVIEQRVAGLGEPTARLLSHAAVLGQEFSLATFSTITEQPPEALTPAARAGLVRISSENASFSHALVQEALYATLDSAERRRLHALAAPAVATVEARAHHLREAQHEQALDSTLQAARHAEARLAYEHAAQQYRAALRLPGPPQPGLLLDLARCEFRSGNVEEAWSRCREAADLGRAQHNARILADAAVIPRGIAFSPLTAEIHALCREALRNDLDPQREARVLAQLAITADPWAPDTEPTAERALAAASDPDTRLLALEARRTELSNARHVHERLDLGARAIELGNPLIGHVWRMDAFGELGLRIPFEAELAAFTAHVRRSREPLWRWHLTLVQAALAHLEGRFADGRDLAAEALAIGRRCGHEGAEHLDLIFASHYAMETGEGLAEIETRVRAFAERGPFFARAWLARILAQLDRRDEAARLWHALLPHLAHVPERVPEWLIISMGNAQMLALLNETEGADTLYTTLLPFAGRQANGPSHTPWGGPISLHLGRLALLLNDKQAAQNHLTNALDESKALDSPPYQALAHLELARLGKPQAAAQALQEAERLGMAPLAARARTLLGPGPLSSRENQVAALIAEGLTNRQIATRLHLSERTVENHVSHILDKLGVPNRTLIATWLKK